MVSQNFYISGVYGTQRITFLKELFKKIIFHALPDELKAPLFRFDHIGLEEWIKSKYSDLEEFKAHLVRNKAPLDDKKLLLSKQLITFMKENGKEIIRILREVRT